MKLPIRCFSSRGGEPPRPPIAGIKGRPQSCSRQALRCPKRARKGASRGRIPIVALFVRISQVRREPRLLCTNSMSIFYHFFVSIFRPDGIPSEGCRTPINSTLLYPTLTTLLDPNGPQLFTSSTTGIEPNRFTFSTNMRRALCS